MDSILLKDLSFYIMFAVLYFLVPWAVVAASYSSRTKFDLSSLWTHKKQIDKLAVILMVTWWVHTSSMILWTVMRSVTSADYTPYMGWAIPIIAKILGNAFGNGQKPPEATTSTQQPGAIA